MIQPQKHIDSLTFYISSYTMKVLNILTGGRTTLKNVKEYGRRKNYRY